MGCKMCNFSFLYDDEQKEENISKIQNQELTILSTTKLKNKPHYFYINSTKFELSPDTHFYNNPLMKIKQIFIINRLKFLSKKIREFLVKRRTGITFATISTVNNDDDNNNNRLTNYNQIYLNTDTGDIAYNNLALIKNKNFIKKNINNIYFKGDEYTENDGILSIIYEDNTKLKGIFYNNSLNGYTKIIFSNKEIFNGEIFNNVANGYGIYMFSRQGCIYEGYWENNYKNGIGKEDWWYLDNYEGEFLKGKKHGKGKYKWKDGSFYEGEWMNNNIHGLGIFNNKNKKIYLGNFIMNQMNGYGEMTYIKNKGFYYGYWKDNKKNGFGVELSPRKNNEDKIYIGFWKDNERYGYGILLHKNNDEKNIMALWKNNKVSKTYKTIEEFWNNIIQTGFGNYLFFFQKTFDEHIKIINNIKNEYDIYE
jgi:hypothetical protein